MRERDGFSQCLVDGDQQSLDRARLVRQKALLVSIIFEAALVAALLLWPLITQGLPPQQFLITPAPPYHGGSNSPQGGRHVAPAQHPPEGSTMMYPAASQPAHFQEHAQSLSSDEAPVIGSGFGPGNMPSSGIGDGESVPGGSNSDERLLPPPPKPKAEKP